MSERCAPRHTYKNLVTGDFTLTVAGGAPIHVYGLWLTAGAALTTFTVKDGAGTTLGVYKVATGTADELSVYWIADGGITVTSDVTASHVTVFHNSPGR
jgi:hypothetical protein